MQPTRSTKPTIPSGWLVRGASPRPTYKALPKLREPRQTLNRLWDHQSEQVPRARRTTGTTATRIALKPVATSTNTMRKSQRRNEKKCMLGWPSLLRDQSRLQLFNQLIKPSWQSTLAAICHPWRSQAIPTLKRSAASRLKSLN